MMGQAAASRVSTSGGESATVARIERIRSATRCCWAKISRLTELSAVVGAVDVAGQGAGDGALDVLRRALLPFRADDHADAALPVTGSPHRGGRSFFWMIPAGAST